MNDSHLRNRLNSHPEQHEEISILHDDKHRILLNSTDGKLHFNPYNSRTEYFTFNSNNFFFFPSF
jgi:hypothetical protein